MMIKRVLCLIVEMLLMAAIALSPIGEWPKGLLEFLLSIIVIFESVCIVLYWDCGQEKIFLSYRELMKYMQIAPDRYYYRSFYTVNYSNPNNELRRVPGHLYESRIHTTIFFTTHWSSIRFLIFFLCTKSGQNKRKRNKYMIRYLKSVDADIEAFKEKSRKEIDDALNSQQDHMKKLEV